MYIPYEFQYSDNVQRVKVAVKNPGLQNAILYHLFRALDDTAHDEKKLDLFLGVNSIFQGRLYDERQYRDSIKMSDQKYKNLFVTYWCLCAKQGNNQRQTRLVDWVEKNRNHVTNRIACDKLENEMLRLLRSKRILKPTKIKNSADEEVDQVAMLASPLYRAALVLQIAKIISLAAVLAGLVMLSVGVAGLTQLNPLFLNSLSQVTNIVLTGVGGTLAIGGTVGFLAFHRIQRRNASESYQKLAY